MMGKDIAVDAILVIRAVGAGRRDWRVDLVAKIGSVCFDERSDVCLECLYRSMDPTPYLLVLDHGKEPLDLVDS